MRSNTPRILSLIVFTCIISFLSLNAQTITDVQPRRVTTGSTVTVTGTGFYPGLEETMRFQPGGYDITGAGSRVYVNSTTMTFTIEQNDFTDRSQNLRFTPSSGTEVITTFIVDYLAPIKKAQKIGDANDVDFRIEEIYTDYSEVKDYKDGDLFETEIDYNASVFGKWEFYGLIFPDAPKGILLETGGTGRGLFIGFNDAGNFVARGGDGSVGSPNGAARLVLDPMTDYDFAGKTGRLVVTMNPSTGVLTLDFDNNNTGTFDYTRSITAVNSSFTDGEWSGGNSGAVGDAAGGSIAGNEVLPANANFNGTIDGMIFSNTQVSTIAWRSTLGTYDNQPAAQVPSNPILPDNDQNLLGFKYNGIIYSTGANDALLEFYLGDEVDNLDASLDPIVEYVPQTFKAYSTNGVQNTTTSSHHIFTGDLLDGTYTEGTTEFLTSSNPNFQTIKGLSMFDVLYDGQNGLNISTGINNLNESASIQFFSGNGKFGSVADGIPDLLIPNMAEAGGTDVYYFTDEIGNIIGRPISIEIDNGDTTNPPLSHWINDQYRVDVGVSFEIAKPTERLYDEIQERPIRLIAFELDDFGISPILSGETDYDPNTSIDQVFNINAGAGGTADIPFLAYNGGAFEIRSPVVTSRPIPRSVCVADGTTTAKFLVGASVDGQENNPSYVPTADEALSYQWFKFNDNIDGTGVYSNMTGWSTNELTVSNIDTDDLGLYKLKVSNNFGTSIISVTIEDGGTRVSWNGSNWVYPPGFTSPTGDTAINVPVPDEDRKLVMTADYEVPLNQFVEGCSCEVFPGKEVIIRENGLMKLYDELNLKQADTIFDPNTGLIDVIIPAGKFILENNASLVQTRPVNFNQNSGSILMKRDPIPAGLTSGDYIYWSSPVEDFEIGNITGSYTYEWDTQFVNSAPNTAVGNWIPVIDADTMSVGKGYIKRFNGEIIPVNTAFTEFKGRPHNGTYAIPVLLSGGGTQLTSESNWNLIGNPYPSAINAIKFLEVNATVTGNPNSDGSQIEGAVHVWTHQTSASNSISDPFYDNFGYNYNGNDYLSKNALGQNPAPSGTPFNNIASGQAFFVKAITTGTVTFNNAMRYDDAGNVDGYDNSQFYRTGTPANVANSETEIQKIWLTLVNNNQTASSTLIGYADGATLEKDNLFDATANGGEFGIYSLIENDPMIIQGRPLPFVDSDVVPLGVTLNYEGIYDIAIDHLAGNQFINEEQDIFLEDVYLGIVHNLRLSPYTFSHTAG
ncbi:immunoglobulin domain-containing protein, partial [Psychroserpens sp.]